MADNDHIYRRDAELERLREMLRARRSFLLHGPAGVGKTVVAKQLASELANVLYSPQSTTSQGTFRELAMELVRCRNKPVIEALGETALGRINNMSAVSIRGVVSEGLRQGMYWVMLDGMRCPSQAFATAIKELVARATTPVMAIARSAHMEDVGFLLPMFADRTERYALRNFEREIALTFAQKVVAQMGLTAANLDDVLQKVVRYSDGNPGAILSMLRMARSPKYGIDGHIAISPLYVDFRLGRVGKNA